MQHPTLLVVSLALASGTLVVAQPSLDPPAGPVGESGRFGTRIELSQTSTPGDADSVFKLTEPGSYVLTGDIDVPTNEIGIEIASNDITLDLNGYTIRGDGSTGTGVGVTVPTSVSETFRNLVVTDGSFRDLAHAFETEEFVRASPDDLTNLIEDTTVRRVRVEDVENGLSLTAGHIQDSSVRGANIGISLGTGTINGCRVRISAPGPVFPTGILLQSGSVRESTVVIDNPQSSDATGISLRDADAIDCHVLLSASGNVTGFATPIGATLIKGCSVRPLFFGGTNGGGVAFDVDGVVVDCLAVGTSVGFRVDSGVVRGCAAMDVATPNDLDPAVVSADNNF